MIMNPYELVITTTKELESILAVHYHADGIGLIQKVNSVETQLPKELVGKVRYLGGIRNKLAHDVDFVLSEPERFKQVYDDVKLMFVQLLGIIDSEAESDAETIEENRARRDKEYKLYWCDPKQSKEGPSPEQSELLEQADFGLVKICYYISVFCLLIGPMAAVLFLAFIPVLYLFKKSLSAELKTHCTYLINNTALSLTTWLCFYLVFEQVNSLAVSAFLIWLVWYLWRNYRGLNLLKQGKAVI